MRVLLPIRGAATACLLLLAACSDAPDEQVSAGAYASEAPSDTVPGEVDAIAPDAPCGAQDGQTEAQLRDAAEAAQQSVFAATVDRVEFQSMDEATARGAQVSVGTVIEVRFIEQAPFGVIPGHDGGSASAAGNTAYWTGVEVDVTDGSSTTTVQIPLIAGGADVLEASQRELTIAPFEPLRGVCAVVVSGEPGLPPELGGPRLAAVGTGLEARPIGFDAQLVAVAEAAPDLEQLASVQD